MAIKTNFIDGLTYLPQDLVNQMKSLLTDGVFGVSSGVFNVLAHSPANLTVDVQTGSAQLKGFYINSDAVESVAIAANTSGYNRIDIIVLEVNTTTKATLFKAVQGTPSSSPTAPLPTNTTAIMQLKLAEVSVGNNVSVINQVNITDKRSNVDLFGAQLSDLTNKFTPENAINPTKLNAWVDYDAATYGQLRYWKDSFGNVYIKGALKAGSGNVPIFTLPIGYRPLKTEIFPSWCNGEVLGHVNVLTDGGVVPYAGNNTLLVINLIFRAGA